MYNILVCDDEKDIVSALNIYLSAEGYRVLTAFDGPEALRLLDREEVHLVLMDVMMPGMDGITAMTRLRQSRNLPVILLTAKSEDPAADNPVAVHVRHIREKIEINPAEPRYLKVVWGKGYKMEGAAQ